MTNTKEFMRNTLTGLALLVGTPSTALLPSCTPGITLQNNQRPESDILSGVSIESSRALKDIYIVDAQDNIVYLLMKDEKPLSEIREEVNMSGGRNGDNLYDTLTNKYYIHFQNPIQPSKKYSVVTKTLSGKVQKTRLDRNSLNLDN